MKYLLILFILSSCSTYIRTKESNSIKKGEVVDDSIKLLEGVYVNDGGAKNSLWSLLKEGESYFCIDTILHKGVDKVSIKVLSNSRLKISLIQNEKEVDSFFAKGSVKGNYFRLRTMRTISGLFPLVWDWDFKKNKLTLDKKGNLYIVLYKKSLNQFLIIPFMAADSGKMDRVFFKVK
jgi:hypothetical protein